MGDNQLGMDRDQNESDSSERASERLRRDSLQVSKLARLKPVKDFLEGEIEMERRRRKKFIQGT